MKILIGISHSEYIQSKKLADELNRNGVDCKLITIKKTYFLSPGIVEHFKRKKQLRKDIKNFQPDFILADVNSDLGVEAIKAKIPLLLYARGNFWVEIEDYLKEIKSSKKLKIKKIIIKLNVKKWEKQIDECFKKATLILPVSKYLENIIKKRYPGKSYRLFLVGIDPDDWFFENNIKIKKPAIGMIQNTLFWDKSKEILILKNILESLSEVNFYWAGSGIHTDKIISDLEKYPNFTYLGNLQYPNEIREFLSSVDIYVLLSGLETLSKTLLEAQMMEKPVIATKIGGIPEAMINNQSGFLVEEGDWNDFKKKIIYLLENSDVRSKMGKEGKVFALNNYSTKIMARKLISYCKELQKN